MWWATSTYPQHVGPAELTPSKAIPEDKRWPIGSAAGGTARTLEGDRLAQPGRLMRAVTRAVAGTLGLAGSARVNPAQRRQADAVAFELVRHSHIRHDQRNDDRPDSRPTPTY